MPAKLKESLVMSEDGLIKTERGWYLKVSAAWATKRWNCTLEHILAPKGCGGCCKSRNFKTWPMGAFRRKDEKRNEVDGIFYCIHLGPNGCRFELKDKPIGCMLTPFVLNPSGRTLVVRKHLTYPTSVCCGAYGNGPMLLDSQKAGFIEIFGEKQFKRVRRSVLKGKDAYFFVNEKITAQWEREWDWEQAGYFPLPRSIPVGKEDESRDVEWPDKR